MTIKILIYFCLVFGTLFLERRYAFIQGAIDPGLFYTPIYLIVAAVLFCLELKSKIKKKSTFKELKWAGFRFAFFIGICWGIFLTFSKGYPRIYNMGNAFSYVSSALLFGLAIGAFGFAVTPLVLKHIFYIEKDE